MMGDVTMSKMISVASGFQYSVNIIKSERIGADGVIFAVIPHSEDSIPALKKSLEKTSNVGRSSLRCIVYAYTS